MSSCLGQQKEKEEEYEGGNTTNEDFLQSLRRSWEEPLSPSSIFLKDIPRLVRRVQVQSKTDPSVWFGPFMEGTKIEAIVALVATVSRELDAEKEAVELITNRLERGDFNSDSASEELNVVAIFETLDSYGPIIKTLKLINQGVVLHAMSVLREDVFRDLMTKDVRTPEGWKIFLRLGSTIQVS